MNDKLELMYTFSTPLSLIISKNSITKSRISQPEIGWNRWHKFRLFMQGVIKSRI